MVICGNGIWISSPSSVTASNCQKWVDANINILYVHCANWTNDYNDPLSYNSSISSTVNFVHTNYPQLKILGLIFFDYTPQDLSNASIRISKIEAMVQATGLDGISDDIEEWTSNGSAQISFYNTLATRLHALNPPRMVTMAKTIGGTNGYDSQVFPGLVIDLLIPMFYNGMNTPGYTNQHWNRIFGYNLQSPISIGIFPAHDGGNGMSSIISAINPHLSPKPAKLAGFSIWAFDNPGAMSSADWSTWSGWTGKNFSGCGGGAPPPPPPSGPVLTTITISPTSAQVAVGSTQQLTAICRDQNSNTMTCPTITWASVNISIATVSSSGLVTGILAGSTNVTAIASGKISNISTITVSSGGGGGGGTPNPVLTSISLSPISPQITINGTQQLTATCKDQLGSIMTGPILTWQSSDNSRATVSSSGLVTGIAVGTTTITASAGSITSNASTITISTNPDQPPASILTTIYISPISATIGIAAKQQLTSICYDQLGTIMSCPVLSWNSTTGSVATVSAGIVTGVAVGSTTITASASGKTSNATGIIVSSNPPSPPATNSSSIFISPISVTIGIGVQQQLRTVCQDQFGAVLSCPTLTWTNSSPSVATVSSTGLVTGVSAGGTTITASAYGNVISNAAAIMVSSNPPVPPSSNNTSIYISPISVMIGIGSAQQLIAVCKDQFGNIITCQTINWNSSIPTVATVNSSGVVTGVSYGYTYITATISGVTSNIAAIIVSANPPTPSSVLTTIELSPSSATLGV